MTLTFTVLGSGNSAGTPAIGNYWGNCDPAEPRNRRLRTSALVRSSETTILIDTGPDMREQINRANVSKIDAVLYTHAHGDHINGVDDLRVLRHRNKKIIDVYGSRETIQELYERFSYMFEEREKIYPKVIEPHVIDKDRYDTAMIVGDIGFIPYEQDHGTCKSLGYRFGDLAYSTDMVDLDEKALDVLKGIKTWVVDAAGYKMEYNKVHATLRQIYAFNEIVQAPVVYLTHLTPQMDYRMLLKELPDGFEPAYDGLELKIKASGQ